MKSITNLEPVEFDLLAGKSVPTGLARTVTPVTPLPPVKFDLRPAPDSLALRIMLEVSPSADPGRVALAVLSLIDDLGEYDRRLGGKGVRWDRSHSDAGSSGNVNIVLTPNDPEGAAERMAKMAEFITGSGFEDDLAPADRRRDHAIVRCANAAVINPAA